MVPQHQGQDPRVRPDKPKRKELPYSGGSFLSARINRTQSDDGKSFIATFATVLHKSHIHDQNTPIRHSHIVPRLGHTVCIHTFPPNPERGQWYDTIVYILWPLLATCVGVVFALWIDRDETSRRQREATVKTLTLCVLDANNTLELIGRAADTAAKHNDGTPSLDTYRKARTLLERFGMPYPDVIQSLLLSESTLTNCSTAYLETVMRELNKLKQLKATMNREMPDEMFFRCIDSYHIALEEILDLTCNEINYINGLMSQSSHDRQIDIVMQGGTAYQTARQQCPTSEPDT